ncbi:MAG: hypothetical protein NZ519_03540 [Bacteroidia bacterium]|nr:hypothetical protein [Bacteroidia bacterium]MDW8347714.1 hypothetical protein [Bacteroidia bacterium]
MKIRFYWILVIVFAGLLGCKKNIFKPKVIKEDSSVLSSLGNRKTVDGIFTWFKNAYEFRDSTLYGKLLHPDFRFTYYDFANNTQISWDRGEEMRIQYRLFQNVKNISLTWNNYIQMDTTATSAEVIRSFNLLLEIDAYTTYRGTGRVIFTLTRGHMDEDWMLLRWFDDSDF